MANGICSFVVRSVFIEGRDEAGGLRIGLSNRGGRHSDRLQVHFINKSDRIGQGVLPPGSRRGLEHGGVLYPGFQCFQSLLDDLLAELLLLAEGAAGVADGIGDSLSLHNAAGSDSLRQVVEGCYKGGGEAGPL